MKTRFLLVLAAVALMFTGCKKDNQEQTLADNTIVYVRCNLPDDNHSGSF